MKLNICAEGTESVVLLGASDLVDVDVPINEIWIALDLRNSVATHR